MNWLVAIISAAAAGAFVAVVAWIRDLRIRVALAELRAADAHALAERISAREIALRAAGVRETSQLEVVRDDTRATLDRATTTPEAVEADLWRETGVR